MKHILPILFIILMGCTPNTDPDKINWEKLNPSAEKLFAKAVEFEKSGHLDSATIYIFQADEKQPNHPYILHKRALIGSSKNDYLGSALINIDKSIRLTSDEKLKKIRYNDRGTIFYKMGEVERAHNDWLKAEEFGEENIKKYCPKSKKTTISKLPLYFSLKGPAESSSIFKMKFPEGSFQNNHLLKGKHIIFSVKPNQGNLHKLFANSNVILKPKEPSFYLNKINDTSFDLFIPKDYSEPIISFDLYIAPNRGYYLVTYFSNKMIKYPDTLHLSLRNILVNNDK